MDYLDNIYDAILDGDLKAASAGVPAALEADIAASEILQDAMIAAMDEVGRLFEAGEYFVPEMLVAARAMKAGLALLRPHLVDSGVAPAGKVVLGTVAGDMHDIGKNLVAMILEGAAGLRSRIKIVVGGAPVTADYAQQIGADGYAADASQAVTLVKSLVK